MRTVATALVLIAGAAVILWYGSTLNNSWVLGGLIGGLAALLLSIPISLTLFSHFSRRHDEQGWQEEEEMHLAHDYDYPAVPRRTREVEADSYFINEVEGEVYDDEEYLQDREQFPRSSRRLPSPSSNESYVQQRQTGVRQGRNGIPSPSRSLAPRQQAYLPAPRQQQVQPIQLPASQNQQSHAPSRNTKSLPSAALNSMSQHRMGARRAARIEEAAKATDADMDVSQTRLTSRSKQETGSVYEQEKARRKAQRLTESPSQSLRSRKELEREDAYARQELYESFDEDEEFFFRQTPAKRRGMQKEPSTDYIDRHLPRTEPVYRSAQTGQIVRRPSTKDLEPKDDEDESEMNRLYQPLVRRAPYMHPEDDAMKRRLSQNIEPPPVRRSSRQEVLHENDEQF
jgi:hypothetical protein